MRCHAYKNADSSFHYFLNLAASRKRRYNEKYIYTCAVQSYANHFGVTISAAKQRLSSLGIKEVSTVFNEVDGRLVKVVHYGGTPIDTKSSYLLNEEDIEKAVDQNPAIKTLLSLGLVVFAEGYFVVNNSKYVTGHPQSGYKLTDLAQKDITKCALYFNVNAHLESVIYDPDKFNLDHFCNGGSDKVYRKNIKFKTNDAKIDEIVKASDNFFDGYQEAEEWIEKMDKKATAHEKLDCLLSDECSCSSMRALNKSTSISATTIKRYRTGESKPTERELLAICFASKFLPYVTEYIMKAFNYSVEFPYDDFLRYCWNAGLRYYELGLTKINKIIQKKFPNEKLP